MTAFWGNESPVVSSSPLSTSHYTNVKDFGAVGDKIADDTAAIKAAIAAAKSVAASGRAPIAVYLPAGDYNISDTLTLGHKVMMVGDGRWSSRIWLTTALPAGVPAIRLDDPVNGANDYQHGNSIRGIGLNCLGNAEIGVLGANVNEGGGLYDSQIYGWTLYGFWASKNDHGYMCMNYKIDDCSIYSLDGNTSGKIAIYIDNSNHALWINRCTVMCHLTDANSVSPGSVGIMYAPASTSGGDADVASALIMNCHIEACEDGIQIYQGRAIILNCDGWTDVTNTVHWTNRGNGWCAQISNRNITSGLPIKDSKPFTRLRSASGTDPIRVKEREPDNDTTLYYTAPYHPGAQGKTRRLFVVSSTPDANGDITITHNLGYSPYAVLTGIEATDGKYTVVKSRTATTVVINVRQAGGAIYTAGSVRIWAETLL